MKTFYIIQMLFGGYYWHWQTRGVTKYTMNSYEAERFESEEEAIRHAPSSEPFTIIKFYDK